MTTAFDRLFIFEMANNHEGDIKHGLAIVREMGRIASRFNVNAAVKLQYRDLDTFIHPAYRDTSTLPHILRFLGTRLTDHEFRTLVQAVKDEGLVTICTPFDEVSVERLCDHGVEIVKVASCSANDWPLLEKVAATGKPIICSIGALNLYQIDNVVSFLTHRDAEFALLHCVGLYPTPRQATHANFIDKLARRFPYVSIGYSGHEPPEDVDTVKVVVAKGAKILERHVGLQADRIRLNAYSMNPEQTSEWVKHALLAYEICGNGAARQVGERERDSVRSLVRGVYARGAIAKGTPLTRDLVYFAMPALGDQTTAFDYHESMVTTADYAPDQPIHEHRIVRSNVDLLRGVIHEIKGMLYEANIVVGKDFRIEISHHYGMERFRQHGAVIVEVINRSYCKKLVIVLPGQSHPTHAHRVKEETFQLLWGDFDITLNDTQRIRLKPGDSLLVEPGTRHNFSSVGGAIIEEISTTHIKGDSFYDDPEINKRDLIDRKTIVENW